MSLTCRVLQSGVYPSTILSSDSETSEEDEDNEDDDDETDSDDDSVGEESGLGLLARFAASALPVRSTPLSLVHDSNHYSLQSTLGNNTTV